MTTATENAKAEAMYPVTRTTRMLADLIGQTEPVVRRAQAEMYAAAEEVRKYETLLASARERHELAKGEYRQLRGLLMIGWEQLQDDIRSTKPITDDSQVIGA